MNRTRRTHPGVSNAETAVRRTALVIESDRGRRDRIRRALVRRGYQVLGAKSQASAFHVLDGSPADVLVSQEAGAATYRVVWLSSERSGDIIIAPTAEGWKRFDEAARAFA